MFLRINLITNWEKFCTCCCLGENFALVPLYLHYMNAIELEILISPFYRFLLFASYVEIYNEQIYDLFQPMSKQNKRVSLKLGQSGTRSFVKDLQEIQVICDTWQKPYARHAKSIVKGRLISSVPFGD